ncbi:MAG: hypothetical protein HW415_563, partial [Deltaproteobacteria bacterium]|nr:hypothetical protein [Deltaproteobacteria bacterium]
MWIRSCVSLKLYPKLFIIYLKLINPLPLISLAFLIPVFFPYSVFAETKLPVTGTMQGKSNPSDNQEKKGNPSNVKSVLTGN